MEKQFVAFRVASSFYCIDIMEVQEVIRESQITVMPNFPSFVEGVINLRGTITPLLSIDKRLSDIKIELKKNEKDEFDSYFSKLSEPSVEPEHKTKEETKSVAKPSQSLKLIIVKVESITIGLLVETLDKILTVDEHQIQNSEGLSKSNRMISGILQIEGEIYTVLDPRYVLESDEAQQLAESLNQ